MCSFIFIVLNKQNESIIVFVENLTQNSLVEKKNTYQQHTLNI